MNQINSKIALLMSYFFILDWFHQKSLESENPVVYSTII